MVVGVPLSNNNNGSVYIYGFINGSWQLVGKVFGSLRHRFGYEISISDNGKRLVAGSLGDAYIYEEDGSDSAALRHDWLAGNDKGCGSDGSGGVLEWYLVGSHIDEDYSFFGISVSLSSDGMNVAVGGWNAAGIYTAPDIDGLWWDAKCHLPQQGLYLLPLDYQTRYNFFTEVPSTTSTTFPSVVPTGELSDVPSDVPTTKPSDVPTGEPSDVPSNVPSTKPLDVPTGEPSDVPSNVPTAKSSDVPTNEPICEC